MFNLLKNLCRSLARQEHRIWHLLPLAALISVCTATGALHAQATLTVNTTDDELTTNGNCSLREALTNANDDATTFSDCAPSGSYGADTIIFAAGTNGTPIVLDIGSTNEDANADGDLDVTDSDGLTITGNGVSNTIIDGNDAERVFDQRAGDLAIDGITVQNGRSDLGAGLVNIDASNLTLKNTTFTGNTGGSGGGVAIRGNGMVEITNCTFENNSGSQGGGLHVDVDNSQVTINKSVFFNNSVSQNGGAIALSGITTIVNISNSTISGNRANRDGGGLAEFGPLMSIFYLNFVTITDNLSSADNLGPFEGGGIFGDFRIENSIVQGNTNNFGAGTNDCGPGSKTSLGGNVFGSGTGCPVGVDDTTGPANLGPLQNNGGSTETHALLAGSAAIDFADCGTVTADQRGFPRPFGGNCDAGALEFSGPPHNFVFLAEEFVESKQHKRIEGDIHSNNDIEIKKGKKSDIVGNLTAVDDIEIGKKNDIDGDVTAGGDVDNDGDVTGTVMQSLRFLP